MTIIVLLMMMIMLMMMIVKMTIIIIIMITMLTITHTARGSFIACGTFCLLNERSLKSLCETIGLGHHITSAGLRCALP